MYLQNLITRFLNYNLWATERVTSWLLTVDQNKLYENAGSSFGTIDRTLQHILAAQNHWYSIIVEGQLNEFNQSFKENAVDEVIAELVRGAQNLVNSLSTMSEQQLVERIKAGDSMQSRYEYILQIVNHTSYHRGQIVTLCRALGITDKIPENDYDAYLWWIENVDTK